MIIKFIGGPKEGQTIAIPDNVNDLYKFVTLSKRNTIRDHARYEREDTIYPPVDTRIAYAFCGRYGDGGIRYYEFVPDECHT